jgi:hypothetical protein
LKKTEMSDKVVSCYPLCIFKVSFFLINHIPVRNLRLRKMVLHGRAYILTLRLLRDTNIV